MKHLHNTFIATAVLSLLAAAAPASAAVIGFTSNATGNAAAWTASANGLGATIDTSINFDTHPTGLLQNNFYAGLGVTMSSVGDSNTVQFGAGPGQNNTSSGPVSSGEGLHAASNFLFDGGNASSFTLLFSTSVYGAGLYVIDYFNPFGNNPLTIEAFDAANLSLGLYSSVAANFQANNTYFMGVTSSAGDIAKLVFTDVNANTGDTTGIDNVVFATGAGNNVPEPGALALVGLALAGLALTRRRKA